MPVGIKGIQEIEYFVDDSKKTRRDQSQEEIFIKMDFLPENGYQSRCLQKFSHLEEWVKAQNVIYTDGGPSSGAKKRFVPSREDADDFESITVVCEEGFNMVKSNLKFTPLVNSTLRYLRNGIFISTRPICSVDELRTLSQFFEIGAIFDISLFPTLTPKVEGHNRVVGMESSRSGGVPIIRFLDIDPGVNLEFRELDVKVYHFPMLTKSVPLRKVMGKIKKKLDKYLLLRAEGHQGISGNVLVLGYSAPLPAYYVSLKWLLGAGVWEMDHIERYVDSCGELTEVEKRKVIDALKQPDKKPKKCLLEGAGEKDSGEEDVEEKCDREKRRRKIQYQEEIRNMLNYFLMRDYTLIMKKKVEVCEIDVQSLKKPNPRFSIVKNHPFENTDIYEDLPNAVIMRMFPTLEDVTKEFKNYRVYGFLKKYFLKLLHLFHVYLKRNAEYQKKMILLKAKQRNEEEEREEEEEERRKKEEEEEKRQKSKVVVEQDSPSKSGLKSPESHVALFSYKSSEMGESDLTETEIEWGLLRQICKIDIRTLIEMQQIVKKIDKIRKEEENLVKRKSLDLRLNMAKPDLGMSSPENVRIIEKLRKKKQEKIVEISRYERKMKGVIEEVKTPQKSTKEIHKMETTPSPSRKAPPDVGIKNFPKKSMKEFKLSKRGSRTFMALPGQKTPESPKSKKKKKKKRKRKFGVLLKKKKPVPKSKDGKKKAAKKGVKKKAAGKVVKKKAGGKAAVKKQKKKT